MQCWMRIQRSWKSEPSLLNGLNCTSQPEMRLTLLHGNEEPYYCFTSMCVVYHSNMTSRCQHYQICICIFFYLLLINKVYPQRQLQAAGAARAYRVEVARDSFFQPYTLLNSDSSVQ